jgi:hypothetical protein
MDLSMKKYQVLVLNMLPRAPGKLTISKDILYYLETVVNKAKTIKKFTLDQTGLGGDPLINDKQCKDP